jgi:hypothetical protein
LTSLTKFDQTASHAAEATAAKGLTLTPEQKAAAMAPAAGAAKNAKKTVQDIIKKQD